MTTSLRQLRKRTGGYVAPHPVSGWVAARINSEGRAVEPVGYGGSKRLALENLAALQTEEKRER